MESNIEAEKSIVSVWKLIYQRLAWLAIMVVIILVLLFLVDRELQQDLTIANQGRVIVVQDSLIRVLFKQINQEIKHNNLQDTIIVRNDSAIVLLGGISTFNHFAINRLREDFPWIFKGLEEDTVQAQ